MGDQKQPMAVHRQGVSVVVRPPVQPVVQRLRVARGGFAAEAERFVAASELVVGQPIHVGPDKRVAVLHGGVPAVHGQQRSRMGQRLAEHQHRGEVPVVLPQRRIAQQRVVVLGQIGRAGAPDEALVVEIAAVQFGVHPMRREVVLRHERALRVGEEEGFLQSLGGVGTHEDAVTMAALLELAHLGFVEPAPSARRHHEGHVGVVEAAECARLLQPLEQAGRPRPGEAGDQQEARLPLPAAFAPAPDFPVVEPTVQRRMVQGDAVQQLVEGRIRTVVRLPLRKHEAQRAPDGQRHNARPSPKGIHRVRHAQSRPTAQGNTAVMHPDGPSQCQQKKKGDQHARRSVLQGLQLLVLIPGLEQAIQQVDALRASRDRTSNLRRSR